MPLTEPVDEDELQADLDKLEQEALDEKMLKTGTMPVADSLNSLPSGPNGASKHLCPSFFLHSASSSSLVLSRFYPPAANLSSISTFLRKSAYFKTVKGKSKAPVEEEDEEAELAKLQAEMAM